MFKFIKAVFVEFFKPITKKPEIWIDCADQPEDPCGECNVCSTHCDVCGTWYWNDEPCELH